MKELSDQKFGQQDQYNIVDDNQINAMLQMKQYARELLSDEFKNFQNTIQEQKNEIESLKKANSELQILLFAHSQNINSHEYIPKHDYEYNSALFSSPVGDNVIEILHELCTKKREKNNQSRIKKNNSKIN